MQNATGRKIFIVFSFLFFFSFFSTAFAYGDDETTNICEDEEEDEDDFSENDNNEPLENEKDKYKKPVHITTTMKPIQYCTKPATPNNSDLTCTPIAGKSNIYSKCEYQCHEEFFFEDITKSKPGEFSTYINRTIIKCVDGQWNSKLPNCEKLKFCTFTYQNNAVNITFSSYKKKDKYNQFRFTCNRYAIDQNKTYVTTCKGDIFYSNHKVCVGVLCDPTKQIIKNAKLGCDGTRVPNKNHLCEYFCNKGYERKGNEYSSRIWCYQDSNGNPTWDYTRFECTFAPCVLPILTEGLNIIPDPKYKRTARHCTIWCDQGYYLEENTDNDLKCVGVNQWSGAPKCIKDKSAIYIPKPCPLELLKNCIWIHTRLQGRPVVKLTLIKKLCYDWTEFYKTKKKLAQKEFNVTDASYNELKDLNDTYDCFHLTTFPRDDMDKKDCNFFCDNNYVLSVYTKKVTGIEVSKGNKSPYCLCRVKAHFEFLR